MKQKNALLGIIFFLSINIFSQEIKIRLQDSESLAPVIYAHIFDGTNGTISNADGVFAIEKKSSKKITISHIGYKTKEILVVNLKPEQLISLIPKSIELDKVEIYSIDNILKNIIKGLKTNYIDSPVHELMFYRVNLMKNNLKGQLSEGYIQAQRNRYFDRSKNRELKIKLIAHKKIDNLKNINYKYYSLEKLLRLSESFIKLNNGYYNFSYSKIDDSFMKIEFYPKEDIEPYEPIYTGYIVINQKNYAILEFKYSLAPIYKEYLTKKKIGSNLYKKDVNASKFVKWEKNTNKNNYRFSFLRIQEELIIENLKKKTEDKYTAIYEIHNIREIGTFELAKTRKSNPKKNVFEYSNFNLGDSIWKTYKPIPRNKEQDSILKILDKYD